MSTATFLMVVAAWCGTPVPMGTLNVEQVNKCRKAVTECAQTNARFKGNNEAFDEAKVMTCFKSINLGG